MELNPLKQINPMVVVAVIIIFTGTYYTLRKIFFLPLIEVMERRNERIKNSRLQVEEAQRAVNQAEKEADEIVSKAKEEADSIVRNMSEKLEELKKFQIEQAREEADKFLEDGRKEILLTKDVEQAKLRKEAVECVGLACGKLLGKVEANTVESVVDKLMTKRIH